ncbi:hypothetical protein N9R79_11775 [Vibrio sp.]|nr:hypothetical protein [Vibrio sp.]
MAILNMTRVNMKAGLIATVSGFLIVSCGEDSMKKAMDKETYRFHGTYTNPASLSSLVFHDAQMTFTINRELRMTKPFLVKDHQVHVEMKESSKEKRENLVFNQHEDGKRLTCNSCAIYGIPNTWERMD